MAQLDLTWQKTRCELPTSHYEEMATLTQTFSSMLKDLREKARLQAQVTHSERMAAIGRLAGTIAHEINNPLGGMLNLVNTMKRFDTQLSETSRQSLDVLERGLLQIRDIVAALLVEAKLDDRPFRVDDIQDVLQLVESEARSKGVEVRCSGEQHVDFERWNLPATKLRQVLLNLLLNAVRAAPVDTDVMLEWQDKEAQLVITVKNAVDEAHFDAGRIAQAFEPDLDQSRSGLGLWVTYQIVTQLGGKMTWHHHDGELAMTVTFERRENE
jgi:signal transduction histidine kinase